MLVSMNFLLLIFVPRLCVKVVKRLLIFMVWSFSKTFSQETLCLFGDICGAIEPLFSLQD